MDLHLKDKVVVVTGASRGIGLATALQFGAEGAQLFICARQLHPLRAAAEKIRRATNSNPVYEAADVTVATDIARLADRVLETYGRIDVLINNVGSGIYKPFLEVTQNDLIEVMKVNFFSQFWVTQRFAPTMISQKSGSIVNVAGSSGLMLLDPPFNSTCTAPAKAAEIRFTKTLALELGAFNIRVNCIAPSFVVVPERLDQWRQAMGGTGLSEQELREKWGARIVLPDHRWCTTEEAAKAIVFVSSPAASYMTGSVVVVDGGMSRD